MPHSPHVAELALEALRAAGEPVRESVLYERVLIRGAEIGREEFIAAMERLGARGHVRVSVEHDLPAHDPEPFGPRFWSVVR